MATDNNCTSPSTLVRYSRCRKRRARISSQATDLINQLGDDLLVEILIRSFPNPKSASRCKAVCKLWSSLISSPCFNRRFVSHQPPIPYNSNELVSVILSFLPSRLQRRTLQVFDCFKDLVLCGFWDEERWNQKPCRKYLICNPFTKKWIALPLAPRYHHDPIPVARLVCEPRNSTNLDLGDDQQSFSYNSEYRFRVVCMVQVVRHRVCTKLDVFCSESGEWTRSACVFDNQLIFRHYNVCSRNGKLFWTCIRKHPANKTKVVGVLNPFRLDIPPTFMDTSATLLSPERNPMLTVSQDVLYLITSKRFAAADDDDLGVVIWRLEDVAEGKYCWRKQCEWLVKKRKCSRCGYERKVLVEPFLHPYNPEIVFFRCCVCGSLLSWDLTREGEVKFLGGQEMVEVYPYDFNAKLFEPRFSCFPTPIPRYKGDVWYECS